MKVLISGGSGMIGREISQQLKEGGHEVAWLSRRARTGNIPAFAWNPDQMEIDPKAIEFADAIINLAGANIAKPWTPEYKNEILRSRVDSIRLIHQETQKQGKKLEAFISASAVGFYPNHPDQEYSEDHATGRDFLSQICEKWEEAALAFEKGDTRTIRMRIGIVLDAKEGALAQMAAPIKWGFGAALGNGKQWMPWIHRADVAKMFVFALENSNLATGAYNAVGPYSLQNKELTQSLARTLKRPLWLPPVPEFALKLMLGEMSAIALASTKCSSKKIEAAGFSHEYPELELALKALYLN